MPLFGRSRKAARSAEDDEVVSESPQEEEDVEVQPSLSVQDYRDFLLERTVTMQPFGVDILAALGLPLCETIRSDFDVPHFDAASDRGYGVRANDVAGASPSNPVSLAVVGQIEAGALAEEALAPRTAMLLAAGAPIPVGVDTVVPIADTDGGMVDVVVRSESFPGEGIRAKGADVGEGDIIAREGDRVTPAMLGVLAGVGIDRILVRPRPRVVVMSFAKDMVEPGLPLTHRGESYDAASWYVAAAARETGALSVHVTIDAEDIDAMRLALADQLIRADLVITVGGNEPDGVLREVLADRPGALFANVDIDPGCDHGFAVLENSIPLVMLPTGLVACAAGFAAFVDPVLRRLQGITIDSGAFVATAERLLVPDVPGRTSLIPVRVVDGLAVRAGVPHTELQAMNNADGLAVVTEQISAGSEVTVLPWRGEGR